MTKTNNNPFKGDGEVANLAIITYTMLMSGEWITRTKIKERYEALTGIVENVSISKWSHNSALKHAEAKLYAALEFALGEKKKDFIETDTNNKAKYRYIGKYNPLAKYTAEIKEEDIERFWDFCNDTYSFIPKSWLEYFFKKSRIMMSIAGNRANAIIRTDINREYTNIELLPRLFEAIKHKIVLKIRYEAMYQETQTFIFHPHYIKEYNGRWQVIGHVVGKKPDFEFWQLALDRIIDFKELKPLKYINPPSPDYYDNYFKDIIGLTLPNGDACKVQTIKIKVRDKYFFGLTETKKLHPSQRVVKEYGLHEDGVYGEFELEICPNGEFYGNILLMKDNLEIVSPKEVRTEMAKIIKNLYILYKDSIPKDEDE